MWKERIKGAARGIIFGLAAFGLFCAPAEVSSAPTQKDSRAASANSVEPHVAATALQFSPGFEVNRGQTDKRVAFLARARGYILFLTADEAVLSLRMPAKKREEPGTDAKPARMVVLRMRFDGANPKPKITAERKLAGNVRYYVGSDPKKWRTGISSYGRVRYQEIYPGVDMVFSRDRGQLAYELRVAPGANPAQIRFTFKGAKKIAVAKNGDLVLTTPAGELRHGAPKIYQEVNGRRRRISGTFVTDGSRVGFHVGAYDRTKPLVIDPTIEFAFVIGGSGYEWSDEMGLAVGPGQTVYIAATTTSSDFPEADQTQYLAGDDGIVFKLDPNSATPVYATYLGSSGTDLPLGIAVDDSGNAYVTGHISMAGVGGSADFPITPGAYQNDWGGGASDGFLSKLDNTGALGFSTYLGGLGDDFVNGVAVVTAPGPWSGIYLVGETGSYNFQDDVTPIRPHHSLHDAFVGKMNLNASAFTYFTYLGGNHMDGAWDVAVRNGEAYVSGRTRSRDFPTVNPIQACFANLVGAGGNCQPPPDDNVNYDVFVAKLNDAGVINFATYLGGGGNEPNRTAIAVDTAGNAYVTGDTLDQEPGRFPTTNNAYLTVPGEVFSNGHIDKAFVAKMALPDNPAAAPSLVYSTYLSRCLTNSAQDIAVDSQGRAYVVGFSLCSGGGNFAAQPPLPGSYIPIWPHNAAFLVKLDPLGQSLVYWGLFGGSSNDIGQRVAVDGNAIYVVGTTYSTDFHPPPAGAFGGQTDIFVVKLLESPPPAAIDLAITKSDAPLDPVTVNNNLVYYLTVTNNGPATATNVIATDALPASFTYTGFASAPATGNSSASCSSPSAPGGNVVCTIAALAPGASTEIRIVVTPTATGTFTNTAQVEANQIDLQSANNQTSETTTVVPQPPVPGVALMLKKDGATEVPLGHIVTYTVSVTNDGSMTATGVRLRDTLPDLKRFALASVDTTQGSCEIIEERTAIRCTLGDLGSGRGAKVTIKGLALIPGPLVNQVKAWSDQTSSEPVQATATTDVVAISEADLGVRLQAPSQAFVGHTMTYNIRVTNHGPGTVSEARVISTIDGQLEVEHAEFPTAASHCGEIETGLPNQKKVICPVFDLVTGNDVDIPIQVKPMAAGTLHNVVSVESDVTRDTRPANDSVVRDTPVN